MPDIGLGIQDPDATPDAIFRFAVRIWTPSGTYSLHLEGTYQEAWTAGFEEEATQKYGRTPYLTRVDQFGENIILTNETIRDMCQEHWGCVYELVPRWA